MAIIRSGKIVTLKSIQELKKKRPRRLIVEFKNVELFNPRQIPGLQFLEQKANRFFYRIEGKIRPVLVSLSQFEIEDIVFPEPELEDVFLAYYAGRKND